jgi:hypothetical protein
VLAFRKGGLHLPCETSFPAQWRRSIPEGGILGIFLGRSYLQSSLMFGTSRDGQFSSRRLLLHKMVGLDASILVMA